MTRESEIVWLHLGEVAVMPLGILRPDGGRSVKGDAVDLQRRIVRQLMVEKASRSRGKANYGQAGEAFRRKFRRERVSCDLGGKLYDGDGRAPIGFKHRKSMLSPVVDFRL